MKSIFIFLSIAGSLLAIPQSPTVVSGRVEITQNGTNLEVIAQNRSIINWEEFSILEGEKATFALPASDHAVLNRVTGLNRSLILGQLQSNGQVILINPHGVLFGPHAKIDTNSFLVSTLELKDEDFLAGNDLHFFSTDSKQIAIEGSISADNGIYFLAPTLTQSGTCTSTQGEITLAACSEAILSSPEGKIRILPAALENLQEGGINTTGVIEALKVRLLADGNLASFAINLDGIVKAKEVSIDGAQIHLGPNANIDLTHSQNGGECNILATDVITMTPTSMINASSLVDGHGGEIILFSSGITDFYGQIKAEGGIEGGDGGFVEVSGSNLAFKGLVSTQAPKGKTGSLLIDPVDITISSAVSANVNGLPNGPFTPVNGSACAGMGGSSILQDIDLTTALGMNSVTISTVGSSGNTCNGDIIFDASAVINYASTNALILSAEGSVLFNTSVTNTSSGAITINQAGGDVILNATTLEVSVDTNGGPISITNVTGDLQILGGNTMGAFARILAFGSTLDVDIGGDILVTGGSALNATATLRSTVGTLTILNADNIIVTGGSDMSASAEISTGTGANAFITCQAMTVISPASSAAASVFPDNDLVLNVTNGDLQIQSLNGAFVTVGAAFELDVNVSNNIIMFGTRGGISFLYGDRESATAVAGGFISMTGVCDAYSGMLPNAELLLIAGTNILTMGGITLTSFSPTGAITLVVDNLFPTSPGIGPGQLTMNLGTLLNTAGGTPLRLFTADPSQNTISGLLNGTMFVQGPPLTDTNNERYGVYFPDSFFISDYAVFYKIPINTPINPSNPTGSIVVAIQPELDDFSELFRLLHPYSEYIYGSIRFSEQYNDPEGLLGIENRSTDYYRLRKKSAPRDWAEIVYDPAKGP